MSGMPLSDPHAFSDRQSWRADQEDQAQLTEAPRFRRNLRDPKYISVEQAILIGQTESYAFGSYGLNREGFMPGLNLARKSNSRIHLCHRE